MSRKTKNIPDVIGKVKPPMVLFRLSIFIFILSLLGIFVLTNSSDTDSNTKAMVIGFFIMGLILLVFSILICFNFEIVYTAEGFYFNDIFGRFNEYSYNVIEYVTVTVIGKNQNVIINLKNDKKVNFLLYYVGGKEFYDYLKTNNHVKEGIL